MIATSIEQSKKLIDLGLNPETADMHWYNGVLGTKYCKTNQEFYDTTRNEYVAAWSLSSLIELMPSRVEEEYKLNMIKDDTTNGYYYNYSNRKERKMISSMAAYNIIDAAYNMVVWLLEKGYIKTERNENTSK